VAGVAQVASILTCTGQLMIAPPAVGPSALASCARLNEVIGSGLLSDQRLDVLASPVLGTGVYLEPMEQLAIDLLRNGHEDLAPALRSVGVQRAGEDQGTVEDWVADFESGRLPLLRGLAVG